MADPVVTLDTERAAVEPGGQVQITVTISNPGTIVEGYTLDVLGEGPNQWAEVLPPEVSVYPQQQGSAVVVFSPPSGSAAPSGEHAFGVRVRSTLDPEVSAVVEGDLEIGKAFGLQAKIIPVTSTGRWRGRHVIQLSNWGNSAARVRLVASDPDAALGFYLHPDVVDLPLGGSSTVRMSVRTRKPFLRGSPTRLPFQVVGERTDSNAGRTPPAGLGYNDPSRPVVDGALNQKPILTRFAVTAVAVLLLAGIGLVAYGWNRVPRATAQDLTNEGVPAKPEGVAADPRDPRTIEVRWTPVDLADGYRIFPVEKGKDGAVGSPTEVDGSQRQARIEDVMPGTEHCFRVVAKRGKVTSQQSSEVCTTTPALPETATPSPSPTAGPGKGPETPEEGTSTTTGPPPGTGESPSDPSDSTSPTATDEPSIPSPSSSLGGGKWVAIGGLNAVGGADLAQQAVDDLTENDVEGAQLVNSTDYPRMTVNGNPTLPNFEYAVVGPFESLEEAVAACSDIAKITDKPCFTGQLEPP
jgi:hypothetical protein